MCADIDVEIVFDVKEARSHGGGDEADDERPRHRRIGERHAAEGIFVLPGHNGNKVDC